jgi:hypothetical protein
MKTLLEMPGDQFDLLLAGCVESDREYAILKNGLVTPYGENADSPRTAVVLCNPAEAKLLIALTSKLGPDAVQRLRQYPVEE